LHYPATLNLATAGALQLGEAADFASNVLKQFGLEVEDTVRVTDVLIKTANSANTDVRQLAEAMKFAGPVAKALGVTMEEAAAQVGVLGDAGIQGGQAGTNLRGVMLALASPTSDAKKVFEGLGLALKDLDPTSNKLVDILERLRVANISAGEAARVFGRRNVAAALVIGESAARVRELTEANIEAAGEAERVAKIMDDSLNGAFLELVSTIQDLVLTLGDSGLGRGLRRTVEAMTDMIRFTVGMTNSLNGSIERAAALSAIFKILVGIIGTIVAFKFASIILGITLAMGKLAFASTNAALATAPLLTIFALLGAAILGLKFGEFLRDEFKIAAEFSAAFARGFLELVENIKLGWKVAVNLMGLAWKEFTVGLEIAWNESQRFLQKGILEVMAFFDDEIDLDLAKRLVDKKFDKKLAQSLSESQNAIKRFNEETAKEVTKSSARINAIKDAALKAFDEIDEKFAEKGPGRLSNFGEFLKKDLAAIVKDLENFNFGLNLTSKASLDVKINIDRIKNDIAKIPDEVDKTNDKFKEQADIMQNVAEGVGDAFGDAFGTAIFEAEKLSDVVTALGQDVAKLVFRLTVTDQISSGLKSLFTGGGSDIPLAQGQALPGGGVGRIVPTQQAFANGGIINGATIFPFANGIGLAGEAGPEAILPLKRGRGGQLGVQVQDGGGTTVQINMTVNTPDAASFRQSKSQILQDLRSGLGRA